MHDFLIYKTQCLLSILFSALSYRTIKSQHVHCISFVTIGCFIWHCYSWLRYMRFKLEEYMVGQKKINRCIVEFANAIYIMVSHSKFTVVMYIVATWDFTPVICFPAWRMTQTCICVAIENNVVSNRWGYAHSFSSWNQQLFDTKYVLLFKIHRHCS